MNISFVPLSDHRRIKQLLGSATFLPSSVCTPLGALTFPFIFLATDLTVRIFGAQLARKIIFLVMLPNALAVSYFLSVVFFEGHSKALAIWVNLLTYYCSPYRSCKFSGLRLLVKSMFMFSTACVSLSSGGLRHLFNAFCTHWYHRVLLRIAFYQSPPGSIHGWTLDWDCTGRLRRFPNLSSV